MFKTIEHYPNYEVSTSGIIRNKTTGNNIKWINNGKGYFTVKLYNSNTPKGRLCLVHRLVLSTHDDNAQSNLDVNHIDGNKGNNHLNNLQWVTKSENTRHAHLTGLFKNRLTIDQVKEIKHLINQGAITFTEIANLFGVKHVTVWKISKGILYDYV